MAEEPAPGRRMRIVVVEDDPEILDLLSTALEERYEVETARRGDAAIELIQARVPDLVVLDIHMPGMTGFEVCKAIRSLRRVRDLPVVFVTARHDSWSRAKGAEAGGDAYVTKPVDMAELFGAIEGLLKRR